MRIYSPISMLTLPNALNRTQKAVSRALESLSTGQRVNRPSDDSAAFSQSIGLDAQARGLRQAAKNANQGLSLFSTADAALGSQLDILQEMRELALQGVSSLLTSSERDQINDRMQVLYEEFNRITAETKFGDIHLLDGSRENIQLQIGDQRDSSLNFELPNATANSIFSRNLGDGTFDDEVVVSAYTDTLLTSDEITADPQFVDLNNDSLDDIVVGTKAGFEVWLNNGDGGFGLWHNEVTDWTIQIVAEDVNQDTYKDLVLLGVDQQTVYAYLNDQTGAFSGTHSDFLGAAVDSLAVRDIDGDTFMDIETSNETFLAGNNDGSFIGEAGSPLNWGGVTPAPVYSSDINGDGYDETVSGGDTEIQINFNPLFPANTMSTSAGPADIEVYDLNSDGIEDLVVSAYNNQRIDVFLGRADGTYGSRRTYVVGFVEDIEVGDINQDGILDIVSADNSSNTLSILEGRGDGTFENRRTVTSTTQFGNLALGDIDRDGDLDIAAAMPLVGQIHVYLNNGSGSFSLSSTHMTGVFPENISLGDVTGDGRLDIINANATGLSVLIGNGAGAFTSRVTYADGQMLEVELADLNNDGRLDVMTTLVGGGVRQYLQNSSGGLTGTTIASLSETSYGLDIADINGDGNLDWVASTYMSNAFVYMGTGSGTYSFSQTLPKFQFGIAVALTDPDGDGIMDAFIANYANASVTRYAGNSETTSVAADIGVRTQAQAERTLLALDSAIANILQARSTVSANIHRLESAANLALLQAENLETARENIIGADLAEETAKLVSAQILQQAQVAVAAQANLNLSVVLELFRNL